MNNEYYVRPVRQHSDSSPPPDLMTFTIEKMWKAYRDCLSKKRGTISALEFEIDRENNLFTLLSELQLIKARDQGIDVKLVFWNDPDPITGEAVK